MDRCEFCFYNAIRILNLVYRLQMVDQNVVDLEVLPRNVGKNASEQRQKVQTSEKETPIFCAYYLTVVLCDFPCVFTAGSVVQRIGTQKVI